MVQSSPAIPLCRGAGAENVIYHDYPRTAALEITQNYKISPLLATLRGFAMNERVWLAEIRQNPELLAL